MNCRAIECATVGSTGWASSVQCVGHVSHVIVM